MFMTEVTPMVPITNCGASGGAYSSSGANGGLCILISLLLSVKSAMMMFVVPSAVQMVVPIVPSVVLIVPVQCNCFPDYYSLISLPAALLGAPVSCDQWVRSIQRQDQE